MRLSPDRLFGRENPLFEGVPEPRDNDLCRLLGQRASRLIHYGKIYRVNGIRAAMEEQVVDGVVYQLSAPVEKTGLPFFKKNMFEQVSVRGWNRDEECHSFELTMWTDGRMVFLYQEAFREKDELSEEDVIRSSRTGNGYRMITAENFAHLGEGTKRVILGQAKAAAWGIQTGF